MATPLHRPPMTLEEFVALPEDDSARYELQEGVLVVAPRPRPLHQDAMFRLGVQIHRFLPPELTSRGTDTWRAGQPAGSWSSPSRSRCGSTSMRWSTGAPTHRRGDCAGRSCLRSKLPVSDDRSGACPD
jgi:hypothetical protein